MRIQLDSGTKHELDGLCEKRGMTQIAVMSRLVRWFVKQDDTIQAAVLGIVVAGVFVTAREAIVKTPRPARQRYKVAPAQPASVYWQPL